MNNIKECTCCLTKVTCDDQCKPAPIVIPIEDPIKAKDQDPPGDDEEEVLDKYRQTINQAAKHWINNEPNADSYVSFKAGALWAIRMLKSLP